MVFIIIFMMKLNDIYKKIAVLEKKVEFLESKLKSKKSSDSEMKSGMSFSLLLGFIGKKIIVEKFLIKICTIGL